MSGGATKGAALVVGAASPLGRAVVRRLAFAGHHVVAADSCPDATGKVVTENTKVGGRVEGIAVDIDKKDARERLFEETLKKVSVLDSLVIVPPPNKVRGDILASSKMQFDELFHSQLTLPFRLVQGAVPHLEKSKNGSVVLFASVAGFTPFIDLGLYGVAQTGVLSMTKALAISTGPRRVRVNAVVVGMTEEDGTGGAWNTNDERIQEGLKTMIPLGRLGRGADAASLVEFLISSRASYIHGENIALTGGVSVRL